MKKCPYCYEDIQNEARKCKHCHEMITETIKDSDFFNFLSSSKTKIIDKYTDYKKNQNKHLRLPTDSEAWKIGDTHFFLNELIVENVGSVELNRVCNIYFGALSSTHNLITERKVIFGLAAYMIEEDDTLTDYVNDLALISRKFKYHKLDKKSFEVALLIYEHMSNITFDNRLKFYKKQLEHFGYFIYMKYKFDNNGHIFNEQEKLMADLSKLNLTDITFSSKWSGLKSHQENPYEFRILNGLPQVNMLFGLIQTGNNFKVDTFLDNDIFNLMMYNFVSNKVYII